jgi:hypothetical protein
MFWTIPHPDINFLKYWKVTTYKPTSATTGIAKAHVLNGIEKWRSIIGNIKKSVIV